MPFDALTYAWNHPERLGPALSGRFAADALGPWTRLDGSFDQLAEAVRPMTAAIVCGLRADAMGLHVDAREVADAVTRDPIRLGGFAGIDPMSASWRDELELEGCEAGSLRHLGAREGARAVLRFTFARKRERNVSERREVARGPHGAL